MQTLWIWKHITEGPISMAIMNLWCSFLEFPGGHRIVICNLKSRNYIFFSCNVLQTSSLLLTPDEMSLGLKGFAAIKLVRVSDNSFVQNIITNKLKANRVMGWEMSHKLDLGQCLLQLEFLRSYFLLVRLLPLLHKLEQLHNHGWKQPPVKTRRRTK